MTSPQNSPTPPASDREGVISALRVLKQEYGDVLGIVEMGIFGSFARDGASADSDLDVYVRTRIPNPYLLVHLKEAIEGRVHRKVDIVRMRERMNPMLKARIEREGVDV